MALCGMFAALMLAVMMVGGLLPASSLSCPALAGALSIPVLWEYGPKGGGMVYVAVSILSCILSPNKEAALYYVLLMGWYPLVRPRLQHLSRQWVRVLIKVILFTADLFLCTLLSIYVLGIPLESPVTGLYVVALVVLGNVAFLLYDRLLAMLTNLYVRRLRPKLFPFRH
jgi:hypothetical protein